MQTLEKLSIQFKNYYLQCLVYLTANKGYPYVAEIKRLLKWEEFKPIN